MNRSELALRLVLSEISDDFENLDKNILPNVAKAALDFGLRIERSEIIAALGRLVTDGLAIAYHLSPTSPFQTKLEGMPSLDLTGDNLQTYFYITGSGKEFLASDNVK